jgi:hypothetical protein
MIRRSARGAGAAMKMPTVLPRQRRPSGPTRASFERDGWSRPLDGSWQRQVVITGRQAVPTTRSPRCAWSAAAQLQRLQQQQQQQQQQEGPDYMAVDPSSGLRRPPALLLLLRRRRPRQREPHRRPFPSGRRRRRRRRMPPVRVRQRQRRSSGFRLLPRFRRLWEAAHAPPLPRRRLQAALYG